MNHHRKINSRKNPIVYISSDVVIACYDVAIAVALYRSAIIIKRKNHVIIDIISNLYINETLS